MHEEQPVGGNVIVYAKIRHPEDRVLFWHLLAPNGTLSCFCKRWDETLSLGPSREGCQIGRFSGKSVTADCSRKPLKNRLVLENWPGERVSSTIYEVSTEDWDDGLWEKERTRMEEFVDPATDTLIFWQVLEGRLVRNCIAGRLA